MGDEWTDKRLDDKFTTVDRQFDTYNDAIQGLARLPVTTAELHLKVDRLIGDFAEQRDEQREAIEQQNSRRAVIVAAAIGAFATIAASCIGVLIVILQGHT